MERCGAKRRSAEGHDAGIGIGEIEGVVPVDDVEYAESVVEVDEMGAAAEEDMLAMVDGFSGALIGEAGGAAAEFFGCFDKGEVAAFAFKAKGGGESGDSAAEDQGAGGAGHCGDGV